MALYTCLIPYTLLFIGLIFFFEDTPQSLLKTKTAKEICQALNRIGKVNKGEDNIISEQEVEEFL